MLRTSDGLQAEDVLIPRGSRLSVGHEEFDVVDGGTANGSRHGTIVGDQPVQDQRRTESNAPMLE